MPVYKIAYGDSVIDGGLFLRTRPAQSASFNYVDNAGNFFTHLSTFSGKSTIRENLLELLENARKQVFFTSFLIQDDQIRESLIKAVRRLKGHVYVLTTLKKNDFEEASLQEGQDGSREWDFNAHMECVKHLAVNGISVRARKDCHAKFAVFDDRYAVVTSANSVPTCFADILQDNGQTRQANPENGVFLEIPSEVCRLANFFRAIWRSAYNYYISPDQHFSDVGEFNKEILPISCNEPALSPDKGQVIWTAPDDYRILTSLLDMIDSADRKIRISSYILKGMKEHVLSRKLEQAAHRNVEIEVLVRGLARKDHLESCCYLKKTLKDKIRIYGDFYNHSKAVVIDNAQAMILTANLDAQHGLDSSVEVGFISKDSQFINSVSSFLDRLKAGCVLEFIANPSQGQAAMNFSTIHEPIVSGDDIIINFNHHSKNHNLMHKLIAEIKSQLVKLSDYDKNGRKKYRLFTNHIVVDFVNNGRNQLDVQQIREDANAANLHFKQLLPKSTITLNMD